MTTLFEHACKAEREVQGRRSRTYTNSFAGQSPTSSSAPALPVPSTTSTTPHERTPKPAAPPATGAVPSTGRTRDIQCHRCKGFGHVLHVRFGNIGIHTVNTPPNIQALGLHIPQKGATAPLQIRDKTTPDRWPCPPRLTVTGHRMVQGAD
jgi:hypothetical protein